MRIIIRDENGNTLYRADTDMVQHGPTDVIDLDGVLDSGIDVLGVEQSKTFESITVTVRTT